MTKRSEHDQRIRAAMKWWRATNPARSPYTRVIHHGWYGHVLWNVEGEAGVLMSVEELLKEYATEQSRNDEAEMEECG